MNLFQDAKEVLDKSGKVNPLGPYGRQKLTGREVATYFRRNKVKDAKLNNGLLSIHLKREIILSFEFLLEKLLIIIL